jgi:hypothetical protein
MYRRGVGNMKKVFEDCVVASSGFINAYMHSGEPEFIPVGDGSDPKQGYYKIPKSDVQKEMHVKNLIVSKASVFMAKRMIPGTSWGDGINYLEVGTGVGSGTTQVPQAEVLGQVALRAPLARKAITSWTYLDVNGSPTGVESNVLQLTTIFNENEAIGAIVEMGLSGGLATLTLGSGYLFNYKTFAVWNKDNTVKLTIVWKIKL